MYCIGRVFKRLLRDEDAPTMAEYGLLLLFIALLVFASVVILGEGISTFFRAGGAAFKGATIPSIP